MKSWLFHLPIVDSVLEQMIGSVIHRQILQTSTEEACEDRVLLLCDGKIQLKHAPAAKMTSIPPPPPPPPNYISFFIIQLWKRSSYVGG